MLAQYEQLDARASAARCCAGEGLYTSRCQQRHPSRTRSLGQTTCDIYASLLKQGLNTQCRFVHAKRVMRATCHGEHVSNLFCYVFAGAEAMAIAKEGGWCQIGARMCSGVQALDHRRPR
jgi:hypothetical protein